MELEHVGREPDSGAYCDCGAAERIREWITRGGVQAAVQGSGNRLHTEQCAVRRAPNGRPYTTAELDAARMMELYVMSRDGGGVDFREVVRDLIDNDVLDDPADVLMRAAERVWSVIPEAARDPFAHDAVQAALNDPGHHRHVCVMDHARGPDTHLCHCGHTWTD